MTTQEIKSLFSKGGNSDIEKALAEGLLLAKSDETYTSVIEGIKADFGRFKKDKLMGVLDYDAEKKTMAQITARFFGTLDELAKSFPELNTATSTTNAATNNNNGNSTTSGETKDVFISYSTKDQTWKDMLAAEFEKEGISYWLDATSLSMGENIEGEIKEGLKNSNFTVLIVSENSLLSTWVSMESLHRLKQEIFQNSVSFLPVIVDEVIFSDDFIFDMHDKFKAEIDKQKENRKKAEERNMKTALFNTRIERLEEILPDITNIVGKIVEGLSANLLQEPRRTADLKRLIDTIKKGRK